MAELGWREFAHYVLHHWPDSAERNFNPRFDALPWREDPRGLEAWQQGRTGVPLVDAGMRQLWHEGWMHNRVRMVAASFLVKHLLQPWQEGERWFWDTLVDADLANNATNWQWVAGCGADAAPFFRIRSQIPFERACSFASHASKRAAFANSLIGRSVGGSGIEVGESGRKLAEGEGFEPSIPLSQDRRLANARTRPLCDPSADQHSNKLLRIGADAHISPCGR